MEKRLIRSVYTAFALLILVIIISNLLPGTSLKMSFDSADSLHDGWSYKANGSSGLVSEIPTKIDVDTDTPLILENQLPEAFYYPQSILFRSSLQQARVYLDGKQIYDGLEETAYQLSLPLASHWILVELPKESDGSILEVELTSPYEEMSGMINEIHYGSKSTLQVHIFNEFSTDFLISLVAIFIGLAMIFTYFLFRKLRPYEMLYLGLFSHGIGLWFLAESRMVQFFIGNQFYIGSSAYLMVALIPIPVFLYVRDVIMTKRQKVMTLFSYLFLAHFVLIILLQLFGIADFFRTVPITIFIVLVTGVIMLYYLVNEYRNYRNLEARRFLIAFSVLAFSVTLEGVTFFLADPIFSSGFMRIGFFLFITILVVYSIRNIANRVKQVQESEIYQELAYKDQLTGGFNRMAFERDVGTCFEEDQKRIYHRLVYIDMNDLKLINDIHGHRSGDEAIRTTSDHIHTTIGTIGECYRIGGDEFACLLTTPDKKLYEKKLREMKDLVATSDEALPYKLEVAVGSVTYDPNQDQTSSDWMHRADKKMYEHKKTMKEQSQQLQVDK